MVKIKICGITQDEEINYLNLTKPDYAGFVFAESKRKIDKVKAEILCIKLLPVIKKAGVFRNQTIDEIVDILNTVNLDIVQLHGNEDIDFIRKLRDRINNHIEVWKAVSFDNIEQIQAYSNEIYEIRYDKKKLVSKKLIDKYLIDGQNPGSGKSYPIEKIRKILDRDSNSIDFFLAGGINPENVSEKILEVCPYGIDVSSGVEIIDESGHRKKSLKKIEKLIQEVKNLK